MTLEERYPLANVECLIRAATDVAIYHEDYEYLASLNGEPPYKYMDHLYQVVCVEG